MEIITGDALSILETLPDRSIGMVLTDLPYGMTANDWDIKLDTSAMWRELKRVVKLDRAILLFAVEPYLSELVLSQVKNFKFKYIWKKNRATGHFHAKHQPLRDFEEIAVFSFSKLPYFPQKTSGHKPTSAAMRKPNNTKAYNASSGQYYEGGDTTRYPKTVLEFDCVELNSPDRIHTNQKPIDLLQYLIRQHCPENETVLDFTCGSGSTGVAATLEKRDFVLIDQNHKFTNHARHWISKVQNQGASAPLNVCFGTPTLFG